MTDCMAIFELNKLEYAFGSTTHNWNAFGELVDRYVRKGFLTLAYETPDGEVEYSFADGSTLEIIKGENHMCDKAYITNGVHMLDRFATMEVRAR